MPLKVHLLKQKLNQQPKLLRSNPAKFSLFVLNDNDDDTDLDDDSIITGYRRKDVDKSHTLKPLEDEELSDYVTVRLFLARAKALEKYRQTYEKA
jgi:hypothetical protein